MKLSWCRYALVMVVEWSVGSKDLAGTVEGETIKTNRAKPGTLKGLYVLPSDTARNVLRIISAAQPISRVELALPKSMHCSNISPAKPVVS